MKKVTILGVLVLILAACTTPSATLPTQTQIAQVEPGATSVQPTATIAQTEATPTGAAEATPAQPGEPTQVNSGGVVVYKIVPGESVVNYEVGETFFNQNNRFNLAVGTTTDINGEISVDEGNPQNSSIGPIQIDISKFTSDSSRRDNAIRDRFLQSRQYPIATFVPTSIEGLPDSYSPGQELTFKVTGDLTIKETTKPATFDVTAKIIDGTLNGTATTIISLNEFGVGPIEIGGMLKTEDEAKLILTLVARP
jgi:polyisoprenoid-binding protein YceI